jgi:hypothetical protein
MHYFVLVHVSLSSLINLLQKKSVESSKEYLLWVKVRTCQSRLSINDMCQIIVKVILRTLEGVGTLKPAVIKRRFKIYSLNPFHS